MTNQVLNSPASGRAATRFGDPGHDPRELGARGGRASGVSRRLREQRRLEDAVLERGNGYARFKVLEMRQRRERELERERIRLDRTVNELMDWRAEEEALLARLHDQQREAEAELAALRERLNTDDGLDAWLAEVGEARVDASAERLGWYDDEETSDAAA